MPPRSERLTQKDKLELSNRAGSMAYISLGNPFADLSWKNVLTAQPSRILAASIVAFSSLSACSSQNNAPVQNNPGPNGNALPTSAPELSGNQPELPPYLAEMAVFGAGSVLFTPEIEGVYAFVRDRRNGDLMDSLYYGDANATGSAQLRRAVDVVVDKQINASSTNQNSWTTSRPHFQDYMHTLLGAAEDAANLRIGTDSGFHHPQLDAIFMQAMSIDPKEPNRKPFIDIATGTFDINGTHPVQKALRELNANNPRIVTIEGYSPPNPKGDTSVNKTVSFVVQIDVPLDPVAGKRPKSTTFQYVFSLESERYTLDANNKMSNHSLSTKTAYLYDPNINNGELSKVYGRLQAQPRTMVDLQEKGGLRRKIGSTEVIPIDSRNPSFIQFAKNGSAGPSPAARLAQSANVTVTWRKFVTELLVARPNLLEEIAKARDPKTADKFAELLKKLTKMSLDSLKTPPNFSVSKPEGSIQKKEPENNTPSYIQTTVNCVNPPLYMSNTIYMSGCAIQVNGIYSSDGATTSRPCDLSLGVNSATTLDGKPIEPPDEWKKAMVKALGSNPPKIKQLPATHEPAPPHIIACGIRLTPDPLDQNTGKNQWSDAIAAAQSDLATLGRQHNT